MENKSTNLAAGLWFGLTVLLAVALSVNLIQSVFGYAHFAYWHYPTLAFSWFMTKAHLEDAPGFQALQERMRIRLQGYSRTLTRAVRSLSALFTFNNPQTEP